MEFTNIDCLCLIANKCELKTALRLQSVDKRVYESLQYELRMRLHVYDRQVLHQINNEIKYESSKIRHFDDDKANLLTFYRILRKFMKYDVKYCQYFVRFIWKSIVILNDYIKYKKFVSVVVGHPAPPPATVKTCKKYISQLESILKHPCKIVYEQQSFCQMYIGFVYLTTHFKHIYGAINLPLNHYGTINLDIPLKYRRTSREFLKKIQSELKSQNVYLTAMEM